MLLKDCGENVWGDFEESYSETFSALMKTLQQPDNATVPSSEPRQSTTDTVQGRDLAHDPLNTMNTTLGTNALENISPKAHSATATIVLQSS